MKARKIGEKWFKDSTRESRRQRKGGQLLTFQKQASQGPAGQAPGSILVSGFSRRQVNDQTGP